jgi:hypothetical protein
MTPQGAGLLKLLAGTATPHARPGAAAPRQAGGADFSMLLQRAQNGEIASGREVTIGKGAGVALNDDQLRRIGAAADRAEAIGASRALVLIDGKAVTLDVGTREVTAQVDPGAGSLLNGIDAVIGVPPGGGGESSGTEAGTGAGTLPLPKTGAALGNASLLRALTPRAN